MEYEIKDSGKRQVFYNGMVRDTDEDKIDYTNITYGPMFDRWAAHLTKAKLKYPDVEPGVPNWTLAKGKLELIRFKVSAFRHFMKWLRGLKDEDHAAGIFFNVNGAEYVEERMKDNGYIIRAPIITNDFSAPPRFTVPEEVPPRNPNTDPRAEGQTTGRNIGGHFTVSSDVPSASRQDGKRPELGNRNSPR